jgi:PPM family protein phosphatase
MTPRTKQSWTALSDIGRVRTHNEDSVLAQPPLFVVADGLGGHEAGEVASAIAVETLRDHAPRRPDAKALARAVKAANREVIRAAREGYGKAGMGTTMTAAIVEGSHIVLAHVGDSRAYLLHAGVLRQLTDDHSMVADMIRRGQLTEAEARYHPNRSVITRALGTDPNMVADTYEYTAESGDRLLLCSDGLTGMLEDAAIAEMLGGYRDPTIAARTLIDAANDAGGHDNISVVIVDIEGDGTSRAGSSVDASGARAGRGLLAVIGWVLLFALLVGGIGYGSKRYAQSRAFVTSEPAALGTSSTSGATDTTVVVVYRGVPGSFANLTWNWRSEETTIDVTLLSPAEQARLAEKITVANIAEANAVVDQFRATAEEKLRSAQPSMTPGFAPSTESSAAVPTP